ncbi:permease prefix domain 1-containing protein [Microlunatus parietis]|uniref:Uncharacterized protein n=1 Tax=Microlunatus parietis TaxID=682979 RepID=A0A7Y9I4M2_9ACTN|nr:permease prefix domain 1-containing protein [Microlunatus parietis]NYE70192.1 hypothetical protein [Microlunatus parietis]
MMTLGRRDPISEVVAQLARQLPPPLRPAGLLREVRDGLSDAAEAYQRAGFPRPEAARRAVADFGPVDDAATEVANASLARLCRLTSYLVSIGYLMTIAAWFILVLAGPDVTPWVANPPGPTAYWFGLLTISATTAGLLAVRRLRGDARSKRTAAASARIVIGIALGSSALTLASSYLVSPWRGELIPRGAWSLHDLVEVFSGAVQVIILAAAARCILSLLAARHLGTGRRAFEETVRT